MKVDAIIVGSGPAGVSAAFPLLDAGLKVLMIDASGEDAPNPPAGEYLALRRTDRSQWDWQIGADYTGLRLGQAVSPKLRVPTLAATFAGFNELNRITTTAFASIGSLASGGLSNAWGAGVARFDAGELSSFPFPADALDAGYAAVARRIGISGRSDDALRDYFGLDDVADPPLALDPNCARILERYNRRQRSKPSDGVRIGRARLALLTRDRDDRQGCNFSGLCLWGCDRRAIYSARYDLEKLLRHPNFVHRTGFVVERLVPAGDGWEVRGTDRAGRTAQPAQAPRVLLAAGTIATTAITLRSLNLVDRPLRLSSNPTAAFVLILPERIGCRVEPGQNMAQLGIGIDGVTTAGNVHCSLFPASFIPAREFVSRFPLGRAAALDLWRMLMPAAVVGNCFLPGTLSSPSLTLLPSGQIAIQGGSNPALGTTLQRLHRRLSRTFRALGAILPPGGYVEGLPGSDIHYAGTLPMTANGDIGTTRPTGEVVGLPHVHVVDAANLTSLPAKPHTLTMMANAHRIGQTIADRRG